MHEKRLSKLDRNRDWLEPAELKWLERVLAYHSVGYVLFSSQKRMLEGISRKIDSRKLDSQMSTAITQLLKNFE